MKEGGDFYKTVKKYFDHLESNGDIELSEDDSGDYESDEEGENRGDPKNLLQADRGQDKNRSGGRGGEQELENIQTSKGTGSKLVSGVKSGSGGKEVDPQGAKDRQSRLDSLLISKTDTKRKELEQKKLQKANTPGIANPPENEFYEDGSSYYTEFGDESPTDPHNAKHPKAR